jgi:hypothetical protein
VLGATQIAFQSLLLAPSPIASSSAVSSSKLSVDRGDAAIGVWPDSAECMGESMSAMPSAAWRLSRAAARSRAPSRASSCLHALSQIS